MSLSRIIEKRYHRYIGFSPTLDSQDLEKEYIVNKNGDLIIPIISNNLFYGSVTVRQGGALDHQEIKVIYSMIQNIGPDLLDVNASYSKVEEIEALYDDNKKLIFNLVGKDLELAQKVASHIQSAIGSWSLLPWADAGMANWNSEEMRSLSDICIYVKDLLELSPVERQQLVKLARLPNSMRPHLIIRSSIPLQDCLQAKQIEEDIVEIFSKSTFFLDQLPQDTLQLAETLEMLLNDQNISDIHEGNK